LRVFGNAAAARVGQGAWQQCHTRAVRSEKWEDSVTEYGTGMRVIAASFSISHNHSGSLELCWKEAGPLHESLYNSLQEDTIVRCGTRAPHRGKGHGCSPETDASSGLTRSLHGCEPRAYPALLQNLQNLKEQTCYPGAWAISLVACFAIISNRLCQVVAQLYTLQNPSV